jgi:pimeloyl-ACP methyl ester carboxylesterase
MKSMAKIKVNDLEHYYEQAGEGEPVVFIHGAFTDARMWEPQWQYFAGKYRVLRYDLRGHGRTGRSELERYSMDTYADDLEALLGELDVQEPIVCGLSWGGSIAQAYAVKHAGQAKALVMSGSAVAIDLTTRDKMLCKFLMPWCMMSLFIRGLNAKNFTRFSMFLARLTMGKDWLSSDQAARAYLEQCMVRMDSREYYKIWQAIYSFHVLALEKISCPTLVLNGELEPRNTYQHTQEILRKVKTAEAKTIPGAGHAMNMELPGIFNQYIEDFILGLY